MDAAPPSPPAPRRRWPWILAGVVGLVLVVVVSVPVIVVYGTATAADQGASCARCAALDWVSHMDSMWWDQDGETRAAKDAAPQHRAALLAQRRDYIRQIHADSQRYPVVAGTDFDPNRGTLPDVSENGDTATVNLTVAARWRNEAPGGLWFYSDTGVWHFELRHDRTGWRIWSLTLPAWCGTYSRCAAPLPSPTAPDPSPTDDDPLAQLRPMLPCGPQDPFRQWHTCAPSD